MINLFYIEILEKFLKEKEFKLLDIYLLCCLFNGICLILMLTSLNAITEYFMVTRLILVYIENYFLQICVCTYLQYNKRD